MQSFQKSLEHSTRKATIAFGGGRDTARTQQIQSNRYMPIADRVRAASSTAAKRAQRGDNKENDGRRRHIAADDAACGNGAHIVAFEDTDDSLLGMAPRQVARERVLVRAVATVPDLIICSVPQRRWCPLRRVV